MRLLSLLLAALLMACVPAAGPAPAGSSTLAKAESAARTAGYAGVFPEPLAGWSADQPLEQPGLEEGSMALQRAYTNADGDVLQIIWLVDSPQAAAAVAAVGASNPGDPSVVVATGAQTMEIAVDSRTVLKLQGAGLAAQFPYFAVMRDPSVASEL